MTNDWILFTDSRAMRRDRNTDVFRTWNQGGVKFEYMYDGKPFKTTSDGGCIITQLYIDNDIKHSEKYGCKREYADSDLGKILVYTNEKDEEGYYVWAKLDPTKYYVRMNPKLFDKYVKVKELLQVDDFVRFSGSKGYKWRKVMKIEGNIVFGQCASQPNEESLVFHTSDNGILTVQEIVRNGEKIF